MGNGYASPSQGDYGWLIDEIQRIQVRLAELETPSGTSMNSLVAQVQQAIANINTTVNAAISANSYTKTQIDSKIASPGSITPADVAAAGQVSSNGAPFKSQASYNYTVATSYFSLWIDGVTYQIGLSPSSELVKTDIVPMTDGLARVMALRPIRGRYLWDDSDTPPKVFLLAEEVRAAGFGPDVAPVATEDMPIEGPDGSVTVIPAGTAAGVNYSQLVVPLIAAVQEQQSVIEQQQSMIAAFAARLDAAGV